MRLLALLLLMVSVAGCAPSVAPLYRDYAVPADASAEDTPEAVFDRLRTALREAGWNEARAVTANLVATEPRTLRDWGLYRLDVSLEVMPIREHYVRVFVHPMRHYVTGGRSKMASLDRGLRNAVFPDLDEALEGQGFLRVAQEARPTAAN